MWICPTVCTQYGVLDMRLIGLLEIFSVLSDATIGDVYLSWHDGLDRSLNSDTYAIQNLVPVSTNHPFAHKDASAGPPIY